MFWLLCSLMTCVLKLLFALYLFFDRFSFLSFIGFVLLVDGFPLLLYLYIGFFFHVGGYALKSDWKLSHLHLNSRSPSSKYIQKIDLWWWRDWWWQVVTLLLNPSMEGNVVFYAYIESRKHFISNHSSCSNNIE
jgi:hypothetical protein